jgi:glyoxylase-like metal-dependent hydrolase (beta-lactamase superfamily II)
LGLLKTNLIEDAVTQIKMSNIISGQPVMWVSAYLVDDLLIDTGLNYAKKELVDFMKTRKLSKIVNTHHHEDHISGNHLLQSTHDVSIFVHPLAVPLLKLKPKLYPYQELTWGYPDPSQAKPIGDVIETENHEFHIIHTPGHSFDHIAVVEPKERWIFVGDVFISVRLVAGRLDESQWQTISSFGKLREFSPLILFPAVNDPVSGATGILDRAISLREETGNRILKLSKDGLNNAQIVEEVFGKEAEFDRLGMHFTYKEYTQNQYSTENLVESFAHGQHLLSTSFPDLVLPPSSNDRDQDNLKGARS